MAIQNPRTDTELRAIASALLAGHGAAPAWLQGELAVAPAPRQAVKADPDAYRGHMMAALSFGGLVVAFLCCVDVFGEVQFAAPVAVVREAEADPDALEAIAMVQDWTAAGDEKPVLRRLASVALNPSFPRAWSAEKTEGDSYLVIYRAPAGLPVYAFEVSLESEAVQATPEAVERLTALRMAETSAQDALAARVLATAEAEQALVARAP
jgi:hypothetical protein